MMMLRKSTAGVLRGGTSSEGAVNALWKSARGLVPSASTARSDATILADRMLEGAASECSSASSLKGFLEVLTESNKRSRLISTVDSSVKGISRREGPIFPYFDTSFRRALTTSSSQSSRRATTEESRKDVATSEDPFDAPTYNIPEKPVTFTEGASYSIIILLGLAIAAAAAYAVFKELIFEPKEYKIYGKALERVQNDSQVRVRIGSPVTGYGQESRNRAARQRIAHKVWTDEDGVEHIEVNFFIRGPHGAGRVYSEMFRDKVDREWKFTYLIVDIVSPSQTRLMLESYVPA